MRRYINDFDPTVLKTDDHEVDQPFTHLRFMFDIQQQQHYNFFYLFVVRAPSK